MGITEIKNDKRVKAYDSYLLESPVPGSRIRYGATIIQSHRNEYYFLINQNISEDPKKPVWKVVNQFKAPTIKDENYIYVGGDCSKNGEEDLKIIALVLSEGNERLLQKVEKAWIVNTESLTIESISPEGIACQNPYYGM